MTLRFTPRIAVLGCVFLASCYPYDESRNKPHPQGQPQATVTSQEQQKLKEQRDRMKEKSEQAKRETGGETTAAEESPRETTTTTTGQQEAAKPAPKKDWVVATKIPGKDGFVLSPYNNKEIDVRNIAPGTLVRDPTYPEADQKYFRVP